jgi:hypothetical protein
MQSVLYWGTEEATPSAMRRMTRIGKSKYGEATQSRMRFPELLFSMMPINTIINIISVGGDLHTAQVVFFPMVSQLPFSLTIKQSRVSISIIQLDQKPR